MTTFLKKLGFTTLISAICSALIVSSSFAGRLPDSTLDFFAENNIYYYNPTGAAVTNCTAAEAQNYAGATVLTEAQISQINKAKTVYEDAGTEYSVPWRILATIHAVENEISLNVPEGRTGGIYNLPNFTFASGSPISDDEFKEQTSALAKEIANNYGKNLDLNSEDGVKRLFYNYDKAVRESFYGHEDGGHYAKRADDMKYSNPADGSTYVMNRYDAARDPVNVGGVNNLWKFIYNSDGEWVEGTTNVPGAYVIYEAIGGTGICGGGLQSGGYNSLESAKTFMERYWSDDVKCTINCVGELGGPKANCVTFVQWFINEYTEAGALSPIGNGGQVVSNLLSLNKGFLYPDQQPQTLPRVFAIFSYPYTNVKCGNDPCGHTGVVLGIDEENNKIYLGQAAYYKAGSNPAVWGSNYSYTYIEKNLSDYTNGDYTYAYTDNILKKDLLF